MTKKSKAGWIALGVGVLVLGTSYYFMIYSPAHPFGNKQDAIAYLISRKPGLDANLLNNADAGYVINRATAMKKGEPVFQFNGKNYSTETGTSV